jgi:hypothetical protein
MLRELLHLRAKREMIFYLSIQRNKPQTPWSKLESRKIVEYSRGRKNDDERERRTMELKEQDG